MTAAKRRPCSTIRNRALAFNVGGLLKLTVMPTCVIAAAAAAAAVEISSISKQQE